MRRVVVGAILGAIAGGLLFFPLSVPLSFTISLTAMEAGKYRDPTTVAALASLFWAVPAFGIIAGAAAGSLIAKHRLSLTLSEDRVLSALLWSVWIVGLVSIEIGFLLSPLTQIGLGNTSTALDLWLFPLLLMGLATVPAVLLASIGYLIYRIVRNALGHAPNS